MESLARAQGTGFRLSQSERHHQHLKTGQFSLVDNIWICIYNSTLSYIISYYDIYIIVQFIISQYILIDYGVLQYILQVVVQVKGFLIQLGFREFRVQGLGFRV